MQRSENVNEIAAALCKAQAKMQYAERDTKNPFFNSTYADLASVWEACRVPLTENGLSVVQTPSADGAKVTVDTMLLHTSGQWICSTLTAVSKKDDAQGIGSVITYLRRYSLQSMVGVAPVDDDGNAASAVPTEKPPVRLPKRKDEEKATVTPLTAEELSYVNEAAQEIHAAKDSEQLAAIGDIIKTKSEPIRNALRNVYQTKMRVLETASAQSQPETSVA